MSNLLQGRLMKGSKFCFSSKWFKVQGEIRGNQCEAINCIWHIWQVRFLVFFHSTWWIDQMLKHVMSKFSKTPRKVISACGRARACASLVANFLASNGESIGWNQAVFVKPGRHWKNIWKEVPTFGFQENVFICCMFSFSPGCGTIYPHFIWFSSDVVSNRDPRALYF